MSRLSISALASFLRAELSRAVRRFFGRKSNTGSESQSGYRHEIIDTSRGIPSKRDWPARWSGFRRRVVHFWNRFLILIRVKKIQGWNKKYTPLQAAEARKRDMYWKRLIKQINAKRVVPPDLTDDDHREIGANIQKMVGNQLDLSAEEKK